MQKAGNVDRRNRPRGWLQLPFSSVMVITVPCSVVFCDSRVSRCHTLRRAMFHPEVSPLFPSDEQPVIGIIGVGAMGKMYANRLSQAGWKKCLTSYL